MHNIFYSRRSARRTRRIRIFILLNFVLFANFVVKSVFLVFGCGFVALGPQWVTALLCSCTVFVQEVGFDGFRSCLPSAPWDHVLPLADDTSLLVFSVEAAMD